MLYLAWDILNIALFIFFIVTCFRAAKLLRDKFGLLTLIVFVFGFLSFLGGANKDGSAPKNNFLPNAVNTSYITNTNASFYSFTTIDKNIASSITLDVAFAKDKSTGNLVPVQANSGLTGSVGSHTWEPQLIMVDPSSTPNVWDYSVNGSLKWKLLGATIYTQNKIIAGKIIPRPAGQ